MLCIIEVILSIRMPIYNAIATIIDMIKLNMSIRQPFMGQI